MNHDETLARLIREAADQVQPTHALDAIRRRTVTAPKESAMSIARTWILGGLGGAVATAAVIGGVYFVTTNGNDDGTPGPLSSPTQPVTPAPSETPSATVTPPASQAFTVPVYWPGQTPAGMRLFREFTHAEGETKLEAAIKTAVLEAPDDPDYTALWRTAGAADCSAELTGDTVTINVDAEPDPSEHARLHDGSSLPDDQRAIAIEQLIYTAQAAVGKGRVPVQFLLDGKHTDTLLGLPVSEPLANAPVLDTLSHVNLSTPSEGQVITGDTINVTGVANSFEANVVLRLQRYEGNYIAFQGPVTAEGWMGEKLFPFSTSIDISKVTPGKYILMAMTDDPSGGAEGPGAFTDTKVITIK